MAFRLNHYVAEWYQHRFLPEDLAEKKFYYLDKHPEVVVAPNGHRYTRKALLRWGPDSCFYKRDLYTTSFGEQQSTAIEERFFGPIDFAGKAAVEYFAGFSHPGVNGQALHSLMSYMSVQKLRTPKGLAAFSELVGAGNQNRTLQRLMQLHDIHCATWTDAVWAILDASVSPTKFIISDNPVTVYNRGCFPESQWCRGFRDPDIRWVGTHTLFPLGLEKLLLLTNLNWARNPYGDPLKLRTNPGYYHEGVFNFQSIQTRRALSEQEVRMFNYIIKARAGRYVAAGKEEWLYPEAKLGSARWDRLTEPYLLMPDPRSMVFTTGMVFGGPAGVAGAYDEYALQPGQQGYEDQARFRREWNSFHAFRGEFARLHGRWHRGRAITMGELSPEEHSEDWHKVLLSEEGRHKQYLRRRK